MLSTKGNNLIQSLSKNAGKKQNVKLYKELRTYLRTSEITYNDCKILSKIVKEHLRNGNAEEKDQALQTWISASTSQDHLNEVITAICTEDWPDSLRCSLFSILIADGKLNLQECLAAQDDWAIRSKILETVVKASATISLKIFLYFIHNNVVNSVFMTKNENIRTLLSEFVLTLSCNYGIQHCDNDIRQEAFETFRNSYVPVIEDLRKNDNKAWYRLCMFTLTYFGRLIHSEIDLINTLLSNIEHGFKSKTVEDKLLSFDCWKVLIDVSSLDHSYLCSSKQLKLLLKPLKVKLSRNDLVTCKRLEIWSHLLAALRENSTASLEEFMNFCYEPLSDGMWKNGHPTWSDVIKNSWPKRTEILMNLIGHYGHDGSCIQPEMFKLSAPVITSTNLLKYKSPILNALSVCSENMLFWEVKSGREKKIKCLWGSLFKIISEVDTMTKETILRDIFVILKGFFLKSQNGDSHEYFDDILQHAFSVIVTDDAQVCDYSLMNEMIVFPLVEVMIGCPDLLEYKVISFMKFFRTCSKAGSRLEYFNRSCDFLRTYKHSGSQMLSAYIWLELANELLSICKAPRDEFDDFKDNAQFLMALICQCYMPESLEQKIYDRWKSILVEIDVISDVFKEHLLDDLEKSLKEKPGLSSPILGFLHCSLSLMTDKSTTKFVTKLLDTILECLKNPCLPSTKLRSIASVITKLQTHITKTDKNKSEPLTVKLFECVEHLLKPHRVYETLKLFKTILPKLPQTVKKTIPAPVRSIITDLTTHSDSTVAQDAIALLSELNRHDSTTNPTFVKPTVSTRTAKIASMSNGGNVASMFAQDVSKSPVRVKGSQITNKVQRSSRTMKIANAMPVFKPASIDHDLNSSDFVLIDKEVKLDTSKLSSHQKEALSKRREDIPALYQDLSQSQHTNDSSSKEASCTMDCNKTGNFKNIFDKEKEGILDKIASHESILPANNETPKRARRSRLSLKTIPNQQDLKSMIKERYNNSLSSLSENKLLSLENPEEAKIQQDSDNNYLTSLSENKSLSLENPEEAKIQQDSDNNSLSSLSENKSLSSENPEEAKIEQDLDTNTENNLKEMVSENKSKRIDLKSNPKTIDSENDVTIEGTQEVLFASDADETLCSQAIEGASTENVSVDKPEVSKNAKRRMSELSKIKMDIVGADEFIGLGRKRRSVPKVNLYSPSQKKKSELKKSQDSETRGDKSEAITELSKSQPEFITSLGRKERSFHLESLKKKSDEVNQNSEVKIDESEVIESSESLASEPLILPIVKPEMLSRKVGRPRKILSTPDISHEKSNIEPPKKRGRRKSVPIEDESKTNEIISKDDEKISSTSEICDEKNNVANKEPAKKRGRRKSIVIEEEPKSNEIISKDDAKFPSTSEICDEKNNVANKETPKKQGRKKGILIEDQSKTNENISKDDKFPSTSGNPDEKVNVVSKEPPKKRVRRKSILIGDESKANENISKDDELQKRDETVDLATKGGDESRNSRDVLKNTDTKNNIDDKSKVTTKTRGRKKPPNDDIDVNGSDNKDIPLENVKSTSTILMEDTETNPSSSGKTEDLVHDISIKSSDFEETPQNGNDASSSNKKGRKHGITGDSKNQCDKIKPAENEKCESQTETVVISTEELSESNTLDNEIKTEEEPQFKQPENVTDSEEKHSVVKEEELKSDDLVSNDDEFVKEAPDENASVKEAPDEKENVKETQDDTDVLKASQNLDDDECIIESSQPVELSISLFNQSRRRSINVKEVQSHISNDIMECIVGNELSPEKDATVEIESNTEEDDNIIKIGDTNCDELTECESTTVIDVPDITASCNPDDTVASVQLEPPTENRIGRKSIFIDLDLDALPVGFDAFEKDTLPGSPIGDDTTTRNSELLNSTLDISPIKDGKQPELEEKSVTPLGTPTSFMKTASSRSAKLMNMLPTMARIQKSPKSFVKRTQLSATSSPTTDRIKRMMLKCNDKVTIPKYDLKDEDDAEPPYVLNFTREVPSPYATPNASILKRKACEALDPGLSPLPKRKRVNFSDPPTTCEKIYFKDINDEDPLEGICVISELNVKKSSPIYPPLTECTINISEVLTHIKQDNLLDNFLGINVKTVGDLAKLNSSQVNQLEFLSNPKLSTITTALSAFADKLISNVQHEPLIISSEESNMHEDFQESDTQASNDDPIDGLRISNIALKMWADLKILCNKKELEYIYNDLQETLKK